MVKTKVTKDLDMRKFSVSTSFLLEKVMFKGPRLACIPLLEMEYLDLTDHTKFLHLETDKSMQQIYYDDTGVTILEPMKWVHDVEQSRLLNLFLVPHYHYTPINTVYVHQVLMLVHDWCLWLREPIPIIDTLIHRITKLPYKGANASKELGVKTGDKELADKMKKEFGMIKCC